MLVLNCTVGRWIEIECDGKTLRVMPRAVSRQGHRERVELVFDDDPRHFEIDRNPGRGRPDRPGRAGPPLAPPRDPVGEAPAAE